MTKSKAFFYFCVSFIAGIFLESVIEVSRPLTLAVLIFALILISVLWKHKKIVVVGFCLIFLVLGVWREQTAELRIRNSELRKYNDLDQDIVLIGRVSEEPDIKEKHIRLVAEISRIIPGGEVENGSRPVGSRPVGEKVLIITNRYPQYKYGDRLRIIGRLKTSPSFEGFNYSDYLAKRGIYSVIYYPDIKLQNRENYEGLISSIYAGILSFKNKLREVIHQNLSPPKSSILGAMILGDKSRMSKDLKEKLNIVGIRHITAVSGMHIVILTSVLMTLLVGLGFCRDKAFYFSITIMSFFVVMTGFQPSGVRAGIMGGVFLLGQKIGRKTASPRTIAITAALMLAVNPFLLAYDVGFQLSFLAVLGLIYLGPIFKSSLRFIPQKRFINLRDIVSMSLAAQVFTLPILLYNFGRVSLIAPLTNVLILPTVYWIMISGFVFGLAGMLWQFLGLIFSFPCRLLLAYLLRIVDFFAHPWAAKTIENLHWFWLIVTYSLLGVLVWWLNKRERLKFLAY